MNMFVMGREEIERERERERERDGAGTFRCGLELMRDKIDESVHRDAQSRCLGFSS